MVFAIGNLGKLVFGCEKIGQGNTCLLKYFVYDVISLV